MSDRKEPCSAACMGHVSHPCEKCGKQWDGGSRDQMLELASLLSQIEHQLEKWANESVTGGWSTHQVDPQRKLADKIRLVLSPIIRKESERFEAGRQ